MTRWYRAYEGTVTDEKLAEVSIIAECSRSVVIATWHAILENAATVNDGGKIETGPRRVAAALCEPVKVLEAVFAGLSEVGMLSDGEVTAWKRRQFESDTSTERSKRHRERQRNADATLQQQDETPEQRPHRHRTETEKKDISSDFEAWYAAYPRHEGKGQAEKAYRTALKATDPPTLLTSAMAFANQRRGEDPKFTPLPASWLNGKRWLDEPSKVPDSTVVKFEPTDMVGWRNRVRVFVEQGLWSAKNGPRPREKGCLAPPDILREFKIFDEAAA